MIVDQQYHFEKNDHLITYVRGKDFDWLTQMVEDFYYQHLHHQWEDEVEELNQNYSTLEYPWQNTIKLTVVFVENRIHTFPALGVDWVAWVRLIKTGITRGIWNIVRVWERYLAIITVFKADLQRQTRSSKGSLNEQNSEESTVNFEPIHTIISIA